MSNNQWTWCVASDLSPSELAKATGWIYSMDPDYYKLFSNNADLLQSAIEKLYLAKESEFYPARFIRRRGRLTGFVTYFSSTEVFARRIHVLKALMAFCPDQSAIKKKLQSFAGAKGPVPADSLYMSKIYVDESARGSGVFRILMEDFIGQGRLLNKDLTMHVDERNSHAIAIYERWSFSSSAGHTGGNYFLMERRSQEGSKHAVS